MICARGATPATPWPLSGYRRRGARHVRPVQVEVVRHVVVVDEIVPCAPGPAKVPGEVGVRQVHARVHDRDDLAGAARAVPRGQHAHAGRARPCPRDGRTACRSARPRARGRCSSAARRPRRAGPRAARSRPAPSRRSSPPGVCGSRATVEIHVRGARARRGARRRRRRSRSARAPRRTRTLGRRHRQPVVCGVRRAAARQRESEREHTDELAGHQAGLNLRRWRRIASPGYSLACSRRARSRASRSSADAPFIASSMSSSSRASAASGSLAR